MSESKPGERVSGEEIPKVDSHAAIAERRKATDELIAAALLAKEEKP